MHLRDTRLQPCNDQASYRVTLDAFHRKETEHGGKGHLKVAVFLADALYGIQDSQHTLVHRVYQVSSDRLAAKSAGNFVRG